MSTLDARVPATSRIYDYLLGGKDNFAVDRHFADQVTEVFPPAAAGARANRRCLRRMVRYLSERGIRQFLDIGCGLPASPNVHEIAQQIAQGSRIVYIDNDPLVAVHARALMADPAHRRGVTFHRVDLRDPTSILAAARQTLDFSRPIGLLLFAVLHHLPDTNAALDAVRRLVAELPTGSPVALSHATYDKLPGALRTNLDLLIEAGALRGQFQARSRDQVTAFLSGLDLIDPGLLSAARWRPGSVPHASGGVSEAGAICYVGVAVKRGGAGRGRTGAAFELSP